MRSITFHSLNLNIPGEEPLKVRVYPKLLGPALSRLGIATLHQTANEENVWVGTKELYHHVITTLKKEGETVDEKRVLRLFTKRINNKNNEPPNIPDLIQDVIREYLNTSSTKSRYLKGF